MSIDLQHFQTRLMDLRRNVASSRSADARQAGTVELDQSRIGRLSRMDALQGQAMQAALARRRDALLLRINAALERINEGEYGYCLSCGDPIDVRRLEADPTSVQCTRCATEAEQH